MGSAPTHIETTSGVTHYLDALDVATVAEASQPLTVEATAPLYDAQMFREARVYPLRDRWKDDDWKEFIREYEQLRAFFIAAARENQAIFVASD